MNKFVVIVIIILITLGCKEDMTGKDTQGNFPLNGIDLEEEIVLGGLEQHVMIRAANPNNPVLLFLHGGPGWSDNPLYLHSLKELEEHFIVVLWNQRGAGKSFSKDIPEESMTIDQLVSDCCELIEILKKRYDKEKIFLVGHSFGGTIGMLTAKRIPDSISAYMTIVPLINFKETVQLSYPYMLEKVKETDNRRALKKLIKIGNPPYEVNTKQGMKKLSTLRNWQIKIDGFTHTKDFKMSDVYSLSESLSLMKTVKYSTALLIEEMMEQDLSEEVTELEIPFYMILGRYDYFLHSSIGERFYNQLKAPKKELIWFENSAHGALYDEPERFIDIAANIKGNT